MEPLSGLMDISFDDIEATVPGRFRNPSWLGRGAVGSVFAVDDNVQQERVALKVLRSLTPESILLLKHEFRSVAGVSHPNLVLLHELFSDGSLWFFTMQLVEGRPITEAFRQNGQLASQEMLRPCLLQLARAIVALHGFGQLHRDVKPSNVLASKSGHVTLLDFGLAHRLDVDGSVPKAGGFVVGSPLYLAPEQISGVGLTPACDWYAFGSILYELLTGRPPFDVPAGELLSRKLTSDVPPPSRVRDGIPTDLDRLCEGLLAREPSKRPSAGEILACLSESDSAPAWNVGSIAPRASQFVGRDVELGRIEHWLWQPRSSGPRLVVLVGPSGIGKTTLAQVAAQRARERGAFVLSSSCHQQESVPFNAWDGAIDELARWTRIHREISIEPELARLFPVLSTADDEHPSKKPRLEEPSERRASAVRSLGALFNLLSDEREVVLFLDDLQWADRDSVRLLRDLISAAAAPPVKIIATARTEELNPSAFGRFLHDAIMNRIGQLLELSALGNEDAWKYLRSLPEAAQRHASRIAQQAQGNPFLLRELTREVDSTFPPTADEPPSLRTLVRRRLAPLSRQAEALIRIVAVFRRPLAVEVAIRAAGIESAGRDEVAQLRSAGLIRTRSVGEIDLIESYHDRLVQAILSDILPEEERLLHTRLAEVLASQSTIDHEGVAYCLARAGRHREAVTHAVASAQAAERSFAFARAADWYQRALDWSESSGEGSSDGGGFRTSQLALLRLLGETALSAGDGRRAARAFEQAEQLVIGETLDSRLLRTDLRRRTALSYLSSGHTGEGEAVLSGLLREAGYTVPTHLASILSGHALARLALRIGELAWKPKPTSMKALQRQAALDVATMAWLNVDPLRAWLCAMWQLREALSDESPTRVLNAVSNELLLSSIDGIKSPGWTNKLVAFGEGLLDRVDDPRILAWFDYGRSMHALLREKWRQAIAFGEAAELRLVSQCHGVHWELEVVRRNYVAAIQMEGDLAAPEAKLCEWLAAAEERRDRDGVVTHLLGLGYVACAQDRPERALEIVERVRELVVDPTKDLMLHADWLEAHTLCYLEPNVELLTRSFERLGRIRSSPQRLVHFFRCWTLGYQARVASVLAFVTSGRESKRWRGVMRTLAGQLHRGPYIQAEAQAVQIEAALYLLEGSQSQAARALARAARISERSGQRLFTASMDYAAHCLSGEAGSPELFTSLSGGIRVASVPAIVRAHVPFFLV